ncbi:MAG: TIGR02117 family protein [Hyphomicrobiales bacterium]|nr:TIGR02117 family protein [Hyphomicrobiales bacterium]MCP4998995.1 TIGR02117 family protein [Hyphomicrobiales bacterium]
MADHDQTIYVFVRRLSRAVVICVVVVLAILAVYLGAAVTGTVWMVDADRTASASGKTTVYVLSSGFHSDIAIPVNGGRAPEALPVLETDLPGGLEGTQYLIIGWGSQTAYTSLLALSDLSAEIIVKALFFDRSVMHILPIAGTPYGEGVYRLDLDQKQYERLLKFMANTFSVDDDGGAQLLSGITQGFGDVFYRARPRFSALYGCNAWTGHALRQAGVSFGRWTPFAQSIEWNMDRLSAEN